MRGSAAYPIAAEIVIADTATMMAFASTIFWVRRAPLMSLCPP